VAEQERVPRKFLEAIFVQLRDHGIVESHRGPQGGHRLSRDPAAVTVADIIRILDGPLALTPCTSRTRFRHCSDCVEIGRCPLRPLMQQARDAIAGILENCSLAQLAGPASGNQTSQGQKRGERIGSGEPSIARADGLEGATDRGCTRRRLPAST
jgi:Rrf2 family protein